MPTREQTLDLLASVIGSKYEVVRWIGGGGMAEVFLARHRLHGGLFAVKVLADHLASDRTVVERFLQEARTAASLSGHSNIVPIFDIGEDQGLHYLIMQYIEGEDLTSCLERHGCLSPAQAVQILIQVAKALVWAHSKGVIHRDLKPSNIRLDRSGRAIVLDFGIAKAGDVPTALTGAGERLGTPFYMAPEQIRGEPCDQRSDLYSLGILFFELLTGKRPFVGENYQAVVYAQLYTPAPSPSEIDPAIDPEYSKIALRLLEKDPVRRYQTAAELLADLKALDAGRDTAALEPLVSDPVASQAATLDATLRQPGAAAARAPRRFKPWLVLAACVVFAAVAALAVVAIRRARPAAEPAPQAGALAEQIPTPAGTMQLAPSGNFIFGDSGKESPHPLRTIFLPGFYVDMTEVSNATYKQFCDATGHPAPEAPPWDPDYFSAKPNYPVVNVSLSDAETFARWAGKRLPSEEEWEKAARGSDGRVFPWGNSPPVRQANLAGADDGFENTAPVDSFPEGASPFGARNMAGNVWELTSTRYPVTPREVEDMKGLLPSVGTEWAVIKGGNFTSEPLWLRAYMRRGFPNGAKSPYIGFRCVKDAK